MTVQEVVWFINHKYGEQAYVVETEKEIFLFSLKSKWIIKKSDFKHFHTYTLFHFNDVEREHYHVVYLYAHELARFKVLGNSAHCHTDLGVIDNE